MGRDKSSFSQLIGRQPSLRHGCLAFGLLLLGSCAQDSPPDADSTPTMIELVDTEVLAPPEPAPVDIEEPANAARHINHLGLEIYKQFSNEAGNVCVSPLSIGSALASILEGAQGDTAREIEASLGLEPGHRLAIGYQRVIADLERGNSEHCQANLANGLVYQKNTTLNQDFSWRLQNLYHTTTLATDFVADPNGARREINAWVSDTTSGMIRNFLGSRDTNVNTQFVLTSALGLNARWTQTFAPEHTGNETFFLQDGAEVVAPMMYQKGHFGVSLESSMVQILRMPYATEQLEMVILLPGKETAIHSLETMLSPDQIESWLARCQTAEVNIYVPRFMVQSEYYLDKALNTLGINCAFDAGCADFRDVARERFWLERTKHACYMRVNESGTSAAAATGLSNTFSDPHTFSANRPFLYLVRDTNAGAILFVGRVMNPLQ